MTYPFAFIWYLVRLALFPPRFAFYSIHGFLIFLSKPGARILVPAGAALVIWYAWEPLSRAIDPPVRAFLPLVRPMFGTELYFELYPHRVELAIALGFATFIVLVIIVSEALRPILGALPAPRRPLLPNPPFKPPRRHIPRVPVRVAVRPLPKGGIDGNWKAVARRMPPEIKALLEHAPQPVGRYGGPSEVTETRPLWPPLDLQTPPADPPPQAAPADPPNPATRAKATARQSAAPVRRSSKQSGGKGDPPAPPPPKRTRKTAAE